MLARLLAPSSLLALLAATGCGNLVGDGPAGDASAPDSSVSGDAASPRGSGCPATQPQNGAPCAPVWSPDATAPYAEPQACEYGANQHCRAIAECSNTWVVLPPDPSCNGNPVGCPETFDAGVGGQCPVQGSCTYDLGRCACVPCRASEGVCNPTCIEPDGATPDAGSQWECEPWPTVPAGCPEPRPPLGSPCSVEGQRCGGPGCFCTTIQVDPGMSCLGGFWNLAQGGC